MTIYHILNNSGGEPMEYVGYGMWGLLGFMVLGIVIGMIFGMARGTKRTLKRMLVLIPFLVLSIFLAPLISRALLLSPLGDLLKGVIEDQLEGPFHWIVQILEDAGILLFAMSLPLIIINFVVFYILVLFFRFVFTPIFSAIFLRKIAPKKDKEGKKIKHNKLGGLALGAVFGCIIFAFMFIPITGLMASLDRMDRYEQVIHATAPVSMTNTGYREIDTVNQYVTDVNKEVNKSVAGIIVGNPVNKFFGDFAFGHLTTIRANGVTINMQRDVETSFELARDAIVIADYISNIKNPRDHMVPVFSDQRNMEYFESVVEKVFRLGTFTIFLDANFEGLLRGLEGVEDGKYDYVGQIVYLVGEDEELQERFREAIYKAVGNLGSQFIKEEALSILELARLVFAEHKVDITTNVSLWEGVDDILEVLGRSGKLDSTEFGHAARHLLNILTHKNPGWDGLTLTEQMYQTIGDMNIFTSLLFDSDNKDLYQLPIMGFLNDFDFSFLVGGNEDRQDRFRAALYDGMWDIGAGFFRDDLGAVIEVIRLVFAEHQVTAAPAPKVSLFEVAIDAFDVVSKRGANPTVVGEVSEKLHAVLTFKDSTWGGKDLAEQVFGTIGGMNVFENLLFNASNPDIHSLVIANYLGNMVGGIEPEQAVIDFNRVMGGLANVITRVVGAGSTVYKIVDIGNDFEAIANFLADNDTSIVAIGEILEILTNIGAGPNGVISDGVTRTLGVSHLVRPFLANTFDKFRRSDGGGDSSGGPTIDLASILDPLVERLAVDGDDILWAEELRAIVEIIKVIGPFLSGNINPDDIINALLSGDNDLFGIIAGSPLLSGIVLGVLDSTINNMLDDMDVGVTFNFDGVDAGEFIGAIGTLVDTMGSIVDWLSDDFEATDFGNLDAIIELFGGDGGGDDNVLVQLFNSGLVIETDPSLGLETSIDLLPAGGFKNALLGLFGYAA